MGGSKPVVQVWEYQCHEGTKLKFRFMNEEERESLKEFFGAPMSVLQRLTSGRILTSQLRIDAFEEAKFWAGQLGVGNSWVFISQNFNKADFQTDLVNWFWECYKKWPWVDLSPEERRELKEMRLISEVVDSDYEVVDDMPDKQVLELGEGSPLTDSLTASQPTSQAEEGSSNGTTPTDSEDGTDEEAQWSPVGGSTELEQTDDQEPAAV